MSVEALLKYYNESKSDKGILGFSNDDIRLLTLAMPGSDYMSAFSKIIEIAEGFAINFENDMEDYYHFIREYIFKHCNEIFHVNSDVEMLGYKSTFNNLFHFLSGYESPMCIANYIKSKPLKYFDPKQFIENKEKVIAEFPTMIRFFDAFKSENKVVANIDDYLLFSYNYLTERKSRNLRNVGFKALRDNQNDTQSESDKEIIHRTDKDLDFIITPPVINAFLYKDGCEGHFFATRDKNINGYFIREFICRDECDRKALIERVLKSFPFKKFIYHCENEETMNLLKNYGFLHLNSTDIRRSALKCIDYPDWYSSISKLKFERTYTRSDIGNKSFIYNDVMYTTYLDISCVPFENVLKCKDENSDSKIVGVNVKEYFTLDDCRYITYKNYCSKDGHYECFDVETGEISSFTVDKGYFEIYNGNNQMLDDISFSNEHSIRTGYITLNGTRPYFVQCLAYREKLMYLPYNPPKNALAYIGFNVITHTVIVYDCSADREDISFALRDAAFGRNVRFVEKKEELYCNKYEEDQILETENYWSDNLKKLDDAYRLIFNSPFELVNKLPPPKSGSWIVSGMPRKYKALKEYLKKYEAVVNLTWMLNPLELDMLTDGAFSQRQLERKLENTHILLCKLFDYGFSINKIKQFYNENDEFFDNIPKIDITHETIDNILKYIRTIEYSDKDSAVEILLPNVLLCKSEMAFSPPDDEQLEDVFEELIDLL